MLRVSWGSLGDFLAKEWYHIFNFKRSFSILCREQTERGVEKRTMTMTAQRNELGDYCNNPKKEMIVA